MSRKKTTIKLLIGTMRFTRNHYKTL